MAIKYQITPKYIAWRIEKILCNLLPSAALRKKLKASMPRKWDAISFSPENMKKYQQILQNYPDVLSPEETLEFALKTRSFSRIGDGEFNTIVGIRNSFNDMDEKLAQRLKEICESGSDDNCLVCLNNYKLPKSHPTYTWFVYHGTRHLEDILANVALKKQKYGDAYFLIRTTQSKGVLLEENIKRLKSLWNGQKLLIVCNRKSPLIEDKLNIFDNVLQKEFLYIPDRNAFSSYDQLVDAIKKYDTSWRVYMEAGATASVLAWDLSHLGYQMFDMGDFYKRSLAIVEK